MYLTGDSTTEGRARSRYWSHARWEQCQIFSCCRRWSQRRMSLT